MNIKGVRCKYPDLKLIMHHLQCLFTCFIALTLMNLDIEEFKAYNCSIYMKQLTINLHVISSYHSSLRGSLARMLSNRQAVDQANKWHFDRMSEMNLNI